MRLIHFADYGGSYPGSFIPMLRAVLLAGREQGWEVEAGFTEVAQDRPWLLELREEGLGGHLAEPGRRGAVDLVERLAGGAQPTIVHTHFTAFDLAAAKLARSEPGRVSAYWHLHSALRPGVQWRLRNAVKFGIMSRGVQEILCVAPNILEQARGRLAPRERLALVPNAIDLDRFQPVTPQGRQQARQALDLPDQATVLLHFGWDWERKGGDVLLRAVAELCARESARCEGDGMGPPLIVATVAECEPAVSLARSLGIAERLRVLGPSDDVSRLYAAADLFLSPSRDEGHPFAVAEALACGVPVVASPIPGHEMIAARAGEACRIASLDSSSLAQAVRDCLGRDPAERERALKAAREWVVSEMDISVWSKRMLERYEHARPSGASG